VREKRFTYPLFKAFIESHQDELVELPEFRNCIKCCKESEILQKHLSHLGDMKDYQKEDIESYFKNEYLFLLLSKLLHSVGGIKFDDSEFDKLYCQIESYLDSRFMRLFALVPLCNFELLGKELFFEEDAKIAAVDSSELDTLIDFKIINAERTSLSIPPYALKIHFTAEKDTQVDRQIPFERIQKVICTLRIFKKGVFWYDNIYCFPLTWEPTRPFSRLLFMLPSQHSYGPKYVLEEEEKNNLMQIWKNFNDINRENRFVKIAIEKFDQAALRQRTEDRLVDYITALEALFLGTDEKGELEYRLALRLATSIGNSAQERVRIRHVLKNAYKQRSSIVHGKKLKPIQIEGKKYSLEDLATHLEDSTRKSLQKFLLIAAQKINHEKLLNDIDEYMLRFCERSFFKETTQEETYEMR